MHGADHIKAMVSRSTRDFNQHRLRFYRRRSDDLYECPDARGKVRSMAVSPARQTGGG